MNALPEIPNETIDLAREAMLAEPLLSLGSDLSDTAADEIVEKTLIAAWPLLYAAALRHAADRFNEIGHPAAANAAVELREWASEATP